MSKRNILFKALALSYLLMLSQGLLSQQAQVFTMQNFISPGINPSYTGHKDIYNLVILSRQQWVGFEGAPKAYFLSSSVPFNNRNSGIGIDAVLESAGPVSQKGVFISYSYTVSISNKSKLSFGLRGGVNSYRIDLQSLLVIDPLDYLFETNVENRLLPNFGAGIHYEVSGYFLDFSVPTILRSHFVKTESGSSQELNREERNINIATGTTLAISEGITLSPSLSAWFISQAPPVLDIGLKAELKEMIGLGLIYRSSGLFGGHISYKISNSFVLGYAYELPLAYEYKVSSGTHEVVIGYNFQFLRSKTLSPRRF
ncbi:MAG: type IX secretion system membrane protein PorP/SprF [Bacteroidales bacterium]|nr:type IX secretion system membrane protein PorP/SprF [Bacteroidales bacterium]